MIAPQLRSDDLLRPLFSEAREILHRRGGVSSRNEAIDVLASLITGLLLIDDSSELYYKKNLGQIEASPVEYANSILNELSKKSPASIRHCSWATVRQDQRLLVSELLPCVIRRIEGIRLYLSTQTGDVLNDIFGTFLNDSFVNEKQLGQYLTPHEVVELMVDMAMYSIGDVGRSRIRVLDPSCGVGSFIVSAGMALTRKNIKTDLVGIDLSNRMIRLAISNLTLSGQKDFTLIGGSGLSSDDGEVSKLLNSVDLILTNPPFGAEFSSEDTKGFDVAKRAGLGSINSEVLFLERHLQFLKPGGQVLAIVPDSVLTNKGSYESIRELLASRADVLSVVSLPYDTFSAAGTNTKTSILHLRKKDEIKRRANKTFVAICGDVGYKVSTVKTHKIKKSTGTSDLPDIIRAFKGDSKDRNHFIASIAGAERWDAGYWAGRSLLSDDSTNCSIGDYAEVVNTRISPAKVFAESFLYIEISDVSCERLYCSAKRIATSDAPSRARKPVRAGDVLISTVRPDRRSISIVPRELDGAICSTGLAVLRPRKIHPIILCLALKSETTTQAICKHATGVAYPVIDESCLADAPLPLVGVDLEKCTQHCNELESAHETMEKNQSALNALFGA